MKPRERREYGANKKQNYLVSNMSTSHLLKDEFAQVAEPAVVGCKAANSERARESLRLPNNDAGAFLVFLSISRSYCDQACCKNHIRNAIL